MNAHLRAATLLVATSAVVACGGSRADGRHRLGERPLRPTIEVLARSVSFDAPTADEVARGGEGAVTVDLVGDRLMDFERQTLPSEPVGTVPGRALFLAPAHRSCCWEPYALTSARPGAASPAANVDEPGVELPATVEVGVPAGLDASGALAATGVQPVGVALAIDGATLPLADLAKLADAGVTSGSPAVATLDVGDPARPALVDLRPPDDRERGSDPSDPPMTAPLPDTLPRARATACAAAAAPMPARYVRTLTALGPVFFHHAIAVPRVVPSGTLAFAWSVVGPDRVRARFVTAAKRCEQSALVEIRPAADLPFGAGWVERPSAHGTIWSGASPLRAVLVTGKLAYDVRGSTAFATRTLLAGISPDAGAPALRLPL